MLSLQGNREIQHRGDLIAVGFPKVLLNVILSSMTMDTLIKLLSKPFTSTSMKQRRHPERTSASPFPGQSPQVVHVSGIDPEKLMKKLNMKFASDPGFEIHVGVNLECGVVGLH